MLRRVLKVTCSLAVWFFDLSLDAFSRLLAGKARSIGTILYFHSVFAEERRRFADMLDQLRRWTTLVRLDAPGPFVEYSYYVALTFDDALTSVLQNAVPELSARQIPFAIFVPAGLMGMAPAWLLPTSRSYGRERVMSVQDLAALDPAFVTIGTHGVTHRSLAGRSADEVRGELAESRRLLESRLARTVTFVSFPYGAYDDATVRLAKESGYDRAFTSSPQRALCAHSGFLVGRTAVDPSDWPCELFLKARGAYRWLPWIWTSRDRMRRVLALRWPLGRARCAAAGPGEDTTIACPSDGDPPAPAGRQGPGDS